MMDASNFTTVFCDDIRQETNGKHILIGVYGTDLVPGILPQTIPLAVWIRIPRAPLGAHTFKFSLASDVGEVGVDGGFEFEGNEDQGAVLAIGPMPVNISRPCVLRAFMSFDGDERAEIGSLQIRPVPESQ